jgi:hypothetical protein
MDTMRTITTMEAYLYLVDEAVFEAGDLIMAEGSDAVEAEAEADTNTSFAHTLKAQLEELQTSLTDGSYAFADEDLPFMAMRKTWASQIPFGDMLDLINHTHRNGLGG